jgi:hypothetical protein
MGATRDMGAKAHEFRAEGLGFEPRRRFRLVVFKTTAFDRSAIPPIESAPPHGNAPNLCNSISYAGTRGKPGKRAALAKPLR